MGVAHERAPGVTLAILASQIIYVNTRVKRPKSRIATNAACFYVHKNRGVAASKTLAAYGVLLVRRLNACDFREE